MSDELPPPDRVMLHEDGSLGFEWYRADERLAIFFEPDPKDSGWHRVTKRDKGGDLVSGSLSELKPDQFAAWLATIGKR